MIIRIVGFRKEILRAFGNIFGIYWATLNLTNRI